MDKNKTIGSIVIGIIFTIFLVVGYFITNSEAPSYKKENINNEDIFEEEQTEKIQINDNINEEIIVDNSNKINNEENFNQIVVEIKGCVNNPNVYTIKEGSRLYDLVQMAGGFQPSAYTKNLHLAEKLYDEETIIVYSSEEAKSMGDDLVSVFTNSTSANENNVQITGGSNLININTADKTALITLKGIGEVTADKIIEYRQQNGLFKSIEDIKNVSGIGDKTFLEFKDDICVK